MSIDGSPSKGELTRRAVLDAAIARFGRDGYRATSVADIARDASVGGTVAYAYFPNKEALFLAAADHDAAAVIDEGVTHILEDLDTTDWRGTLVFTLIDAVDRHPLARRLFDVGARPGVDDRLHAPRHPSDRSAAGRDRQAAQQLRVEPAGEHTAADRRRLVQQEERPRGRRHELREL